VDVVARWRDFLPTLLSWANGKSVGTIRILGDCIVATADTMGSKDTPGFANVYIEDSYLHGGSNGVPDVDDSCRW